MFGSGSECLAGAHAHADADLSAGLRSTLCILGADVYGYVKSLNNEENEVENMEADFSRYGR